MGTRSHLGKPPQAYRDTWWRFLQYLDGKTVTHIMQAIDTEKSSFEGIE